MDNHSVELLEFDHVRRDVAGLCIGEEGSRRINEQPFLTDRKQLDGLLELVVYAQKLIEADIQLPSIHLSAISAALEFVRKEGAALVGEDIAAIGHFINGGTALTRWARKSLDEKTTSPFLTNLDSLPDVKSVSDYIFSLLEEDGSVKESLPELKSLRRRLRNTQNDISALASSYLQREASLWQTDVPTQKDGRLVLPLKANNRGRIKGIIREVSQTGATIFVEPFDPVEKNNAYAMLEHEFQLAVAKIYRDCSEQIRASRAELIEFRDSIADLDAVIARARYGARRRCSAAFPLDRGFYVKEGRHPLLGDNAVPIEVMAGEENPILIITGPNAGGKTVTLKTIGLFALMNQFGMTLPAGEGTAFQLYSDVLADIGDDQSIEESLSTFSGHMKNIARFTRRTDDDLLVLLDELASGTDPEEGSAIAMSVLDHFLEKNATVIATTHQSVLKNYAFSKEGVVNASVSFDSETHRPTYSIILGLPGESHALEIAENSGIEGEIMAKARRYLDEQSTDVAQIIREITAQQRQLNEKQSDFEKKRTVLLEQVRETDLKALRLKQRETELRTQGYMQLTNQIQENRRQLENLIRELREGELNKDKTRAVKEFIDKMEKTAEKEREEIAEAAIELSPVETVEPGMEVLVGRSRQRGTVVRKAKKGYWVVATDKLRITVSEADIKEVVTERKQERKVQVDHASGGGLPAFTLDLRGHRLAEALDELERQIDRSIMAGLSGFEVIHGHGEGILKRGIHDMLRKHQSVKDFNFALPEAGGFGKTIVELKG